MRLPPLRHWLVGLVLSLALVWGAGALLLDSVQPVALDPALGRYVPQPGTTFHTRGEGFAVSTAGEHGMRGLPGGALPQGAKVVFWGDSFVEGLQVDDQDRMAQVFTQLASQAGLPVMGVGIGTGGDTLIDCIVKAPDYARVLTPVRLNVFVLGRISDVLPDNPRPCRANFFSTPAPHIEQADCPPSELSLRLAPALARLELGGLFHAYLRLRALAPRLSLGPVELQAMTTGAVPSADHDSAWDFLLDQARRSAGNQLLFLYLPMRPLPQNGAVSLSDPEGGTAQAFAAACARHKIPFLNLGPALTAHYQATGRFPRGFFNTPPGSGHLNEVGHRLVAQTLVQHLQEHPDALLAR
jgi:lysophospholipase L1-like esterase